MTSRTSARYTHTAAEPRPRSGGSVATRIAAPSTAGVYAAAKRSMKVCTGAFCVCASSTRRRIRAKVESESARVARAISGPLPFTVPA